MPTARMALRSSVSTSRGLDAVNPSIERDSTMSASAVGFARAEQLADRVAEPQRVADQPSADLVRHAGQGRDALLERQREQFVPRDLDLVLDHAVDAQLPVGWVDLRHDERRVDAVEPLVRRDHRREPQDSSSAPAGTGGAATAGAGRRSASRMAAMRGCRRAQRCCRSPRARRARWLAPAQTSTRRRRAAPVSSGRRRRGVGRRGVRGAVRHPESSASAAGSAAAHPPTRRRRASTAATRMPRPARASSPRPRRPGR